MEAFVPDRNAIRRGVNRTCALHLNFVNDRPSEIVMIALYLS
jgi:hypothetical protein